MADLLKEFFERDLSEEEEARLAEQVSMSEKESARLARYAAAHYRASGQPALEGEGNWRGRIGWMALLLGLVAGGWWMLRVPALQQATPVKVVRPAEPAHPFEEETAPASKSTAPPLRADRVQVRSARSGFVLLLDTAQAGPARIRVMDRKGALVREIFKGDIASGVIRFEWDGVGESGQKTGPGIYRIEIQRPGETLRRLVEIETH